MLAKFAAPVALAVASVFAASAAEAAVNITVSQSGSDVVLVASGSFDVSTAKRLSFLSGWNTYMVAGIGLVSFNGRASEATTEYALESDVGNFGVPANYDHNFTTNTSGTQLQVAFGWNRMILPKDYVSNAAIDSRTVYTGMTLAQMGMVKGIYSGMAGTNEVTVLVAPDAVAAVPEPSAWALMLVGFGVAGAAMRRRRAAIATDTALA